jgi:hypothetical protein
MILSILGSRIGQHEVQNPLLVDGQKVVSWGLSAFPSDDIDDALVKTWPFFNRPLSICRDPVVLPEFELGRMVRSP